MFEKLSQRDKRALRLGVIGVGIIFVFTFALGWFERWAGVRSSINQSRKQLAALSMSGAEQQKLLAAVPVFEIPKYEEEQKFLFRKEINKQLKESGIKVVEPLKFVPAKKSTEPGYMLLCIRCTAEAELEKILDMLVNLKKNPYLVRVEEFVITKIEPEKKESRKFKLNLKVSTFIKEKL